MDINEKEKNEVRELIIRSRERDDLAFAELVSRYTPMMNKLISGLSDPTVDRDELFAEACVGLHAATLKYDLTQNAVTFGLFAGICIKHRLLDLLRSANSRPVTVDTEIEEITDGDTLDNRLVERETVERLMSIASAVLSDYEYRVLLLYMQGYKTGAIASALSRTPKSVDNAKWRIFKRLREAAADISDKN